MMVSPHPEALEAWFRTQQMITPELGTLDLRPCRVSAFREAYEVVFTDGERTHVPLILSCFKSKAAAFSEPALHDLNDPLRLLAKAHTEQMVAAFKNLIDEMVEHYTYHAHFIKQHLNVVLKSGVEATVLSADRGHLTLLVWYQGERGLVAGTHTYDLEILRHRDRVQKRLLNPAANPPQVGIGIKEGFINLLKVKYPNRRTLPMHSILAFCARIMNRSQPVSEGDVEVVFENDTLKLNYKAEGVSLHFNLTEEIPIDLTGNYKTLKAYEELDQALLQKKRQDHDVVWHFARLPTRFNDKPSKRAVAYLVGPDAALFYHRFEKLYLLISVHYG